MYPYVIEWFKWVAHVPAGLEALVLFAAGVAAFFALRKTVFLPAKATWKKWNAAVDSLVGGHDAIMDPDDPNKELKPATLPLSQRVAGLEDAMNRLLDMQEKQISLNERLLSLEEWRKGHETWSEEIVKDLQTDMYAWRKEHETMHALAGTITHDLKNDNQ